MKVSVIGAGLAGCEAAYQLAKQGFEVNLYEMRPSVMTPAHKTGSFAELVCSNSLRSDSLTNAVGLLKEELRTLDSLIMRAADKTKIPAGSALAVDRTLFSDYITKEIESNSLIHIINKEVTSIPEGPTIIATGPLTSPKLLEEIKNRFDDDGFYFFDAAAPIVTKDSIDMSIAYIRSRYEYGGDDYINCPFTKEEFDKFYYELISAQTTEIKEFEKEIYFEGCLPIEIIAKRGQNTLVFGPMKPVGLEKDDGSRPYAVVQLRRDNQEGTLYNIVGFQTHLKWGEQKRVFSLIPGLENAEFVRYGVMHKNSYICAPKFLKPTYQSTFRDDLFFAGQFSGVEGYIESTASGLLAGINLARYLQNKDPLDFTRETMIGAMANYITHSNPNNFQPMNANWGIFQSSINKRDKLKKEKDASNAIARIKQFREIING